MFHLNLNQFAHPGSCCGHETDDSFAGVPLRDLNLKRGLLLAGIVRQNGQIVIPSGNDVLHLHDDVIVVTTDTQLEDLRDILAE